jgi:hypothetical protein
VNCILDSDYAMPSEFGGNDSASETLLGFALLFGSLDALNI